MSHQQRGKLKTFYQSCNFGYFLRFLGFFVQFPFRSCNSNINGFIFHAPYIYLGLDIVPGRPLMFLSICCILSISRKVTVVISFSDTIRIEWSLTKSDKKYALEVCSVDRRTTHKICISRLILLACGRATSESEYQTVT